MSIKLFLSIIALSASQFSIGQTNYKTYKSPKYGYAIEHQTAFKTQNIIGSNIDYKVADPNGNSIIVIVKNLNSNARVTSEDLLNIPNSNWEANLQLPNVKIIKKGKAYVDGEDGMFLHYTSKDISKGYTLYYTNYMFVVGGYLFTLTATCDLDNLARMQPIFFRSLQSFDFPR